MQVWCDITSKVQCVKRCGSFLADANGLNILGVPEVRRGGANCALLPSALEEGHAYTTTSGVYHLRVKKIEHRQGCHR